MANPLKQFYAQRARNVQAMRQGRGLPRTPKPKWPKQLERAYYRDLRPLLRLAQEAVDRVLLPALPAILERARMIRSDSAETRADDLATDIKGLVAQVKVYFQRRYTEAEAERLAKKYAESSRNFTAQQIQDQFRRVLSVDALSASPAIEQAVKIATVENVALITSIPATFFDKIEKATFTALRTGAATDDLADEIKALYDVTDSRAAFIARDQIAKMNGVLTEVTQTSLGITGYIWRTTGDARVRDTHAALDGKHFDWDDPPAPGHPGQDYNCRCQAEPDFTTLGDSEFARELASE
jgi:SPP1 gp7 family putative phage head morphogenesis protein